MINEIGSEFWDAPLCNEHSMDMPYAQWFLSGRSALRAVIQAMPPIKTVCLPSWCCDSMIIPFLDVGIKVSFYPVYFNMGLVQEIREDSDALLIMDYFGYSSLCPDLSHYNGIVIRDVTHSILSRTYTDADYYFGSLRKWCGIWTGGFAWGKEVVAPEARTTEYSSLRKLAMEEKKSYMNNSCGFIEKRYLNTFERAEKLLERCEIEATDPREASIIKRIDKTYIKTRRRKNANILMDAFKDLLIFNEMKKTDCPLFVPLYVPDGKRDQLRRYLIEHQIYCPVHWPVSSIHRITEKEQQLFQNEISLVCDQRYSEDDMYRIVHTVREFFRKA